MLFRVTDGSLEAVSHLLGKLAHKPIPPLRIVLVKGVLRLYSVRSCIHQTCDRRQHIKWMPYDNKRLVDSFWDFAVSNGKWIVRLRYPAKVVLAMTLAFEA